jgi:Mg-chelatase subunit ChlD
MRSLAARLVRSDAAGQRDGEDELAATGTPRVWFLLDRSGSMGSIADAVVDGYNRFFAEQRAPDGATLATVVQFDSEEPHEIVVDDAEVAAVAPLDHRTFEPRGMTPLYDALGRLLDRAIRTGGHPADQIVVILTDGLENASTTWTREATFARVAKMREDGWTFVFLGANQDSYATGRDLDFADGSVSNFLATPDGVLAAWDGASRVVRQYAMKTRQQRLRDRDDPWGDVKEAEQIR